MRSATDIRRFLWCGLQPVYAVGGAAQGFVLAFAAISALALTVGCGDPQTLILATTTSTADSGLLEEILPGFELEENVTVRVLAVGTGQAMAIAERGDADVLLVHDTDKEE